MTLESPPTDRAVGHAARAPSADEQPSLEAYGVIGNRRTAALVSAEGSVDWWCAGRFDAPSVFARILDAGRGGYFRLGIAGGGESAMEYEPWTNILRTVHEAAEGRLVVHDFMPLTRSGDLPVGRGGIVRVAKCERGRVDAEATFAPRPDYARSVPRVDVVDGGAVARHGGGAVALATDAELVARDGEAVATVSLSSGEHAVFAVTAHADAADVDPRPLATHSAMSLLHDTRVFWSEWIAKCRYEGPYREAVVRSLLVLKLLQHAPTGGLVAAPTTSIPEHVGGSRNWDYRYVWMRDAAFAAAAYQQAGHKEDARALASWIARALEANQEGHVPVLHRIDCGAGLEERVLSHLDGYRGSRPVRVGNAAHAQWQIDVYGELLDALEVCRVLGAEEEVVEWPRVRALVERVRREWREPDSGMWEVRRDPLHFVSSKLMAWVALDRGVRAIEDLDLEGPVDAWRAARDEVRDDVLQRGFDEERNAFVAAYGLKSLDAAVLLMPIVGFLPPTDPRVEATVERVRAELTRGGLVMRYVDFDDGIGGPEGTFTACSLWLSEALAMMGRLDEAKDVLERVLETAGPLMLLGEEVDPESGAQLGNFPLALSHAGLVHAAAAIAHREIRGADEVLPRRVTAPEVLRPPAG